MDLGVFGGTFNPIHLGHLRVAEEARQALRLDRLVFVPAKEPPHKAVFGGAPPGARLDLIRLATGANPHFDVSDLELTREGPSYSVDTLRQLRAQLGTADRLWFLIGADAFAEIHTWYRFAELFELADIAVMGRPPLEALPPLPRSLGRRFAHTDSGFRHDAGREVRFVPVTLLDISSTQIRRALAAGQSIRYLVPEVLVPVLGQWRTQHPDWFTGSQCT